MQKTIALFTAALLIGSSAFAEEIFLDGSEPSSAPIKKLQQIYRVYGDVNLLPTTRMLYYKPRIVVKIVYPKVESMTEDDNIDNFNQAVTDLTNSIAADFRKQVTDMNDVQAAISKSDLHNNLTIDFDTSIINADQMPIISIRFTSQGYISGVSNPAHRYNVLNFDLANGQTIELDDLFRFDANYLEVLSEYSRSVLSRKLTDKQMLMEGTEPKPENFRNWNIKPYGLMITFDETQVAPYVNGPQTVLIPFTAIKGILASDTPLADCLKHQKRCFRNKVLTGGFMDEAAVKSTSKTQSA